MCNKKMIVKCKHEFETKILLDDYKKIDEYVVIKGLSYLERECSLCGKVIKELCTAGFFENG